MVLNEFSETISVLNYVRNFRKHGASVLRQNVGRACVAPQWPEQDDEDDDECIQKENGREAEAELL